MFDSERFRGFYGIVDDAEGTVESRVRLAEALVDGGARTLQLRLKTATGRELTESAAALVPVARGAGVPLIVNDRLDVALAVGADGVHLGQDDLALADARAVLSGREGFAVGISTHDLDQVAAAIRGGATYIGYGPVFATATKQNPDPVQGLDALRAAVVAAGSTAVVAIGGVSAERAPLCYRAGAAAVCAIAAVNGAPDVAAAAREFGPG